LQLLLLGPHEPILAQLSGFVTFVPTTVKLTLAMGEYPSSTR
jgi:hypothetical protein